MRKTISVLIVLVSVAIRCFSQDIITTKTGEDILAKIIEVGHTEIKYKKYDNPNGPLFVVLKADVLMIRYDNGTKEIFNQAPKSPAPSPTASPGNFSVDEKLVNAGKVEKYRRLKHTGMTFTALGGILLVVGIVTVSNSSTYYNYNGTVQTTGNPEAGAAAVLFGLAGLGTGIPLWAVGAHKEKKYAGLSLRWNMNPQGKGFTLAYRFP